MSTGLTRVNQPESYGKWLGGPPKNPGPTCAAEFLFSSFVDASEIQWNLFPHVLDGDSSAKMLPLFVNEDFFQDLTIPRGSYLQIMLYDFVCYIGW